MTQIRPAEPRDAEAIAAILNQTIRDTTITFTNVEKTAADMAAAIPHADAFLVAEHHQTVIGYASLAPFRQGVGYAATKEHSIHLATQARGAGTGGKLLAALEKIARGQGVKHMVAGISGENAAAIGFHQKHGYMHTGRLPGIGQKFNRSIDLVLMQKTL